MQLTTSLYTLVTPMSLRFCIAFSIGKGTFIIASDYCMKQLKKLCGGFVYLAMEKL